MIRKWKRGWALFLSAALIVTQLPVAALAENSIPEDGGIASFAELSSSVEKQTVPVGTAYEDLKLPDTVTAEVYHITEEENSDPSLATDSDADGSVSGGNTEDSSKQGSGKTVTTVTTSEEEIPVTWESVSPYDGDTEGKYVFTADVGGYSLSSGAKPPEITVTVMAETVENSTENPSKEPLPCTKTEGCTLEDGHEGECVMEHPRRTARLQKPSSAGRLWTMKT